MRQIERASQLSEGRFSEKSFRSELRDLSLTRVTSSVRQYSEFVNMGRWQQAISYKGGL